MGKIAIKGHPTRGKEVIEILEMLGGENKYNLSGDGTNAYYLIEFNEIKCGTFIFGDEPYAFFTLEEFLSKYPYKLNDLVLCDDGLLGIITKMEWDCEKSDMKYDITFNTLAYNKWYNSKNIKRKFISAKDNKLAIKGHKTRGKEVIEILEMLGCVNESELKGYRDMAAYFIKESQIHHVPECLLPDDYKIFTIEEFFEKFPYKVGDKVKIAKTGKIVSIEGMSWRNEICEVVYETCYNNDCVAFYSAIELQPYKEETMESKPNLLQQLKEYFDNTPREVIEKEWHELSYLNEIGPTVEEYLECVKKYRQSYQYPKTYEECCDVLEIKYASFCVGYQEELLDNLQQLIVCRDAYWKIAGWNPKVKSDVFYMNTLPSYLRDLFPMPTEEMRDNFFNNFKELFESCKAFL